MIAPEPSAPANRFAGTPSARRSAAGLPYATASHSRGRPRVPDFAASAAGGVVKRNLRRVRCNLLPGKALKPEAWSSLEPEAESQKCGPFLKPAARSPKPQREARSRSRT